MSEHAADKAQEWTVEEDGEWCMLQSPSYGQFLFPRIEASQVKSVADCINASINAERDKVKELEQLRTLTLERYLTNEQKRIVQQLQKQFAAERERCERGLCKGAALMSVACDKSKQQLRVQLAERDAARQPLVDALEESVKLQAHYAKLLNMHDGGCRHAFFDGKEWMERLAKAKEGK
jgi:hypothetical protein